MLKNFELALAHAARTTTAVMDRLLSGGAEPEARLRQAMRYGALAGGKRLRPFFVLASAQLFNVAESAAARVAAAVEFVHAYSLIHDDLPAMDDDDLRRGQPTVHKKFDEATAILAGDALQALAFEVLADPATHGDPAVRCDLVRGLAVAIGAHGMVGGQMMDLAAGDGSFGIGEITRMQRLKTGELIAFACTAGAILGKAAEPSRHALHAYAHDLGLAFQIADDLIDAEGDAALAGKAVGKDKARGKATFVDILGIERARAQARLLADQAGKHLDIFEEKADLLRQAAQFVVSRRH
ncbi:MAG: ispA [Alphaproteobacteria bacterium]|nr:ispA [Alphaproteobacteria bacterium]